MDRTRTTPPPPPSPTSSLKPYRDFSARQVEIIFRALGKEGDHFFNSDTRVAGFLNYLADSSLHLQMKSFGSAPDYLHPEEVLQIRHLFRNFRLSHSYKAISHAGSDRDKAPLPPLMQALSNGAHGAHEEIVALLNADPNCLLEQRGRPQTGDLAYLAGPITKMFLEGEDIQGGYVNFIQHLVPPTQHAGQSPITLAIACDPSGKLLSTICVWLQSNPERAPKGVLNERNGEGQTPLTCAIEAGLPNCVDVLLDAKADVNAPDDCGRTPLMVATCCGNEAISNTLMKKGALTCIVAQDGTTALSLAMMRGKAGDEMRNQLVARMKPEFLQSLRQGGDPIETRMELARGLKHAASLGNDGGVITDLHIHKEGDDESLVKLWDACVQPSASRTIDPTSQAGDQKSLIASDPRFVHEQLMSAVREGNQEEIRALLGRGAFFNAGRHHGDNAISELVKNFRKQDPAVHAALLQDLCNGLRVECFTALHEAFDVIGNPSSSGQDISKARSRVLDVMAEVAETIAVAGAAALELGNTVAVNVAEVEGYGMYSSPTYGGVLHDELRHLAIDSISLLQARCGSLDGALQILDATGLKLRHVIRSTGFVTPLAKAGLARDYLGDCRGRTFDLSWHLGRIANQVEPKGLLLEMPYLQAQLYGRPVAKF